MHPLTGRVMNPALERKDVELYRDANCNFIRTSHYPPCEELLEVCDELGMFVEVGAPVCWIGHHANENWKVLNYRDPKYYPYVLTGEYGDDPVLPEPSFHHLLVDGERIVLE